MHVVFAPHGAVCLDQAIASHQQHMRQKSGTRHHVCANGHRMLASHLTPHLLTLLVNCKALVHMIRTPMIHAFLFAASGC